MNPGSQGEKVALVKVLNEADLDPLTGRFDLDPACNIVDLRRIFE